MKTDNMNVEQYVVPELISINLMLEGVLCASGDEVPGGGNEGIGSEGEM